MRRLFRLAIANSWIVILCVVAGAGGAYAYARSQTKIYSASAVVRVFDPNDPGAALSATGARVDPVREVQIEVLYAKSAALWAGVEHRIGSDARLVASHSVSGSLDSDTITMVVQSRRASVARDAAKGYAQEFVDERRATIAAAYAGQTEQVLATITAVRSQIAALDVSIAAQQPPLPYVMVNNVPVPLQESEALRNLDGQRSALVARADALGAQASALALASSSQQTDLGIVQSPTLPTIPIIPLPRRDAAIGGVLGLLLAFGIVGLRSRLRDRVTTSADLARVMPALSFIAAIPPRWSLVVEQRRRRGPRFDVVDGRASLRDAYRAVRTSVLFADPHSAGGSLLVTSANPGEGKTTIAANLAVSLACAGARVLVVDCDLRRPTLHQQFSIESSTGLSSVLTTTTPASSAIRSVTIGGTTLDVLPAGPRVNDPADLLVRPEVATLIEDLQQRYDHVVLDGPAILAAADALALARAADGVLLVVQSGETKASVLGHVDVRLRRVAAHVAGAVLLGVRADRWPTPGATISLTGRGRLTPVDGERSGPESNGHGADAVPTGDVLVL